MQLKIKKKKNFDVYIPHKNSKTIPTYHDFPHRKIPWILYETVLSYTVP